MKNLVLSVICIFTFTIFINAQTGANNHTWRVTGEPQYLFINGLKFNIEKRLKKQNNWFIVSPSFYFKEYNEVYNPDNRYSYDFSFLTIRNIKSVTGIGLSVGNRMLLIDSNKGKSNNYKIIPYCEYGLMYNFYRLKRYDEDWIVVPEDGIDYMQVGTKRSTRDISKVGLNFTMGVQAEIFEDIIIDIYIGSGLRHSFYEGDIKYNKTTLDYGYKGILLLAGVKFGVGFD
jgi:hypothetical protein